MEALNIALKVDGEEAAWGFSNESYYYAATGRGLWRHPDYEMPLSSHFRVGVTFESTVTSREFRFHINNAGRRVRDLIIHPWGACQDCSGR